MGRSGSSLGVPGGGVAGLPATGAGNGGRPLLCAGVSIAIAVGARWLGKAGIAYWKAGAAYRTRTCDPRMTKAREAFVKSDM